MSGDLPDTGALIYIAVKPLIRFLLPTAAGGLLCFIGHFPLAASRGAGQLILNILLPCLLFSKVVQAFSIHNVAALGPLILIAIIYEAIGLAFAWLVRLSFPVPKNFRNGLLAAGMLGNWGDLPFAILQTVTASAPFDASKDPALSQAYASIFIVIFLFSVFPFRGIALIARDYKDPFDGGNTDPPLARYASRLFASYGSRKGESQESDGKSVEVDGGKEEEATDDRPPLARRRTSIGSSTAVSPSPAFPTLTHQRTNQSTRSHVSSIAAMTHDASVAGAGPYSLVSSPTGRFSAVREIQEESTRPNSLHELVKEKARSLLRSEGGDRGATLRRLGRELQVFARALPSPPTIALVIALVVSLVTPLKALFVTVPDYNIRQAPDGKPVLDIIFQTAEFAGDAAIPVSLVILGSALARIRVPRPISKLPLRAIVAMTLGRMVIFPILGILIVQAMTIHTSLVPKDDKVLRYCMMLISVVPSSTQQIVLSEVTCPQDRASNAPTFGVFLLLQYAVLCVALTIVSSYSLTLLFH